MSISPSLRLLPKEEKEEKITLFIDTAIIVPQKLNDLLFFLGTWIETKYYFILKRYVELRWIKDGESEEIRILESCKDVKIVQKCDIFLTMTGFKFLPRQQKATPAYGNACLHEAFRRKQALRRGGTAFDEWAKRLAGMSPHWGVK